MWGGEKTVVTNTEGLVFLKPLLPVSASLVFAPYLSLSLCGWRGAALDICSAYWGGFSFLFSTI